MDQPLILVVDDEDSHRYTLTKVLSTSGYTTIEAASGREALARIAQRPRLVVLDVNLPDISGYEVCQRMRLLPGGRIPILQVSAYFTRREDKIHGLDGGADGYLVHPIDPRELLATVRALLRLYETEEALSRSNMELQQFAHAAAHDLKEPMRIVSNYIDLVGTRFGELLPEQGRQYLDAAASAARRSAALVDDLLALSRIDQGERRFVRVCSRDVVQGALDIQRLALDECGARVELGDLPDVMGHEAHLRRVFQNLIGNAIKFRSERPLIIRISAVPHGDMWMFSVVDNGIGIDEIDRERIFRMFERAHGQRFTGSGLGLAMCERIVSLHGGRIWVESQAGVGSTFCLTLPAAPAVVDLPAASGQPVQQPLDS